MLKYSYEIKQTSENDKNVLLWKQPYIDFEHMWTHIHYKKKKNN